MQNHYVGMAVFTRNGDNDHDKHVIATVEDGCIAGYLQFQISRISFCFSLLIIIPQCLTNTRCLLAQQC